MPRIDLKGDKEGSWAPNEDTLYLPEDKGAFSRFRERLPQVLAHEISHQKFGHRSYRNPYYLFLQEADAWLEALELLPLEEIDVQMVEDSLDSYLETLAVVYDIDSKEYKDAEVLKSKVISKAIRKVNSGEEE